LAFNAGSSHLDNRRSLSAVAMLRSTKPPTQPSFIDTKARGAAQVQMPQAPLAHRRRIIGIAEIDPLQIGAIHCVRREKTAAPWRSEFSAARSSETQ
jgi:hypothetical protein